MLKRVCACLCVCLFFYWGCRIYSINKIKDTVSYKDMYKGFEYNNLEVEAVESGLYTYNEFLDKFDLDDEVCSRDIYDTKCKILCVCIQFDNKTGKDMSWDELNALSEGGFESTAWASTDNFSLESMLNQFSEESFRADSTQKVWYVSIVNTSCFKKENWDKLDTYDFYYVISLSPEKIKIKLDV